MDIQNIIDSLTLRSGAVVTVSKRLATYTESRYDAAMRDSGRKSWPRPLIISLDGFLNRHYSEARDGGQVNLPPLLTNARSAALWEKVVLRDKKVGVPLSSSLIDKAYTSYKLLCDYSITLPSGIYLTDESAALKRWIAAYDSEVKALGYHSPIKLAGRVTDLIKEGRVELPLEITFLGFDDLTPAVSDLISALNEAGVSVSLAPDGSGLSHGETRVVVRSFTDEAEEVKALARWIRETIKPGKRIGVIVPELARYSSLIVREFRAELNPDSVLPAALLKREDFFNISLGQNLSQVLLVKSALDLLSIGTGRVEIGKLFTVLSSPYISHSNEERSSLAAVDAILRKDNYQAASVSELCGKLKEGSILFSKLSRLVILFKGFPPSALPSKWAEVFNALLSETGWPGEELSSAEFQAHAKWIELLASFGTLDDIVGEINRIDAVRNLTTLARTVRHQPETPVDSPVQVLGLLEATGQSFDYIYLLGAHEDSLPGSPRPNPFIPASLQKEAGVRASSFELNTAFKKRALAALLGSAPTTVASYPRLSQNKELQVSPLLLRFASTNASEEIAAKGNRIKDAVYEGRATEDIPPDFIVPFSEGELAGIRGGVGILREQSACPFKAFATYRLSAAPLDTPEPGLTPMERGSIVHEVLRIFWSEVKDSKRLRELHETERLGAQVKGAVAAAIDKPYLKRDSWKRYMGNEKRRLESLTGEWLALELKRAEFTVSATEKKEEISLECGLDLSITIDRVDTLPGGERVLIDYKSGRCSASDWLGERPKEPQMPLYIRTGDFSALAFGSLKRGEPAFKGLSEGGDVLPGVKAFKKEKKLMESERAANFSELKERFAEVTSALAEGFTSGDAAVSPRDLYGNDSPCKYCDLTVLCRITEMGKGKEFE
ncbi:MAG: PD-(D/E)XK nuclease family protein [Thermodesulfobacteriota bacterium]